MRKVTVPIEPTPEMIAAAWAVIDTAKNAANLKRIGDGAGAADIYRAMILAAPQIH